MGGPASSARRAAPTSRPSCRSSDAAAASACTTACRCRIMTVSSFFDMAIGSPSSAGAGERSSATSRNAESGRACFHAVTAPQPVCRVERLTPFFILEQGAPRCRRDRRDAEFSRFSRGINREVRIGDGEHRHRGDQLSEHRHERRPARSRSPDVGTFRRLASRRRGGIAAEATGRAAAKTRSREDPRQKRQRTCEPPENRRARQVWQRAGATITAPKTAGAARCAPGGPGQGWRSFPAEAAIVIATFEEV